MMWISQPLYDGYVRSVVNVMLLCSGMIQLLKIFYATWVIWWLCVLLHENECFLVCSPRGELLATLALLRLMLLVLLVRACWLNAIVEMQLYLFELFLYESKITLTSRGNHCYLFLCVNQRSLTARINAVGGSTGLTERNGGDEEGFWVPTGTNLTADNLRKHR